MNVQKGFTTAKDDVSIRKWSLKIRSKLGQTRSIKDTQGKISRSKASLLWLKLTWIKHIMNQCQNQGLNPCKKVNLKQVEKNYLESRFKICLKSRLTYITLTWIKNFDLNQENIFSFMPMSKCWFESMLFRVCLYKYQTWCYALKLGHCQILGNLVCLFS